MATLADLRVDIPAAVLSVLAAPRGLDVGVTGPRLVDAHDQPVAGAIGEVVLIAGPAEAAVPHVAQAGYDEAAAVVVKSRGGSVEQITEVALSHGVAVLRLADETPWPVVDALVRACVGTSIGEPAAPDGLYALANALAQRYGGSVSVEDLDRRILAYSSIPGQRIDSLRQEGILGRRVPDTPENREQYAQVFATDDVVRFARLGNELERSAVAVRAGTTPLGTIWAIEGDPSSAAEHAEAMADAAAVAAGYLLRARHADEVAMLARGIAVQTVLDGAGTAATLARIGIPSGQATLLLVSSSHVPLSHLADAYVHYLRAYSTSAAVALLGDTVCVLCASRSDEAAMRATSAVRRRLGEGIVAAVTGPYSYPDDLVAAFAEVSEVLAIARSGAVDTGDDGTMRLEDVRGHLLLERVRREITANRRLQHPGVQALLDHDARTGSELARTLLAWLDEGRDVKATAQRLHAHPNTVRYRVNRALQTCGPDSLEMHLQLACAVGD